MLGHFAISEDAISAEGAPAAVSGFFFADRVQQTTTTSGTGTVDLNGTVLGFQTFVAGIGNGGECYYVIEDTSDGNWEVGVGTVTAGVIDKLSRDRVIASTSGGNLVPFAAGTKNVFHTGAVAERLKQLGAKLVLQSDYSVPTSGTQSPIPWGQGASADALAWDHGGWFDEGDDDRFTVIPEAVGRLIHCKALLLWSANSTGFRNGALKRYDSGDTLIETWDYNTPPTLSGQGHLSQYLSASFRLDAGDYVRCEVATTTGSIIIDANLPGVTGRHSFFEIAVVGW